jgi:hypothetical protein
MGGVWTPTPDEELEEEIRLALARPGASRVSPPRPVSHATGAGWLYGRMRTPEGAWLGLAVLQTGYFFEPGELHWYPASELRVLGD